MNAYAFAYGTHINLGPSVDSKRLINIHSKMSDSSPRNLYMLPYIVKLMLLDLKIYTWDYPDCPDVPNAITNVPKKVRQKKIRYTCRRQNVI